MQLRPNPPRLVTVVIALALGGVGLISAGPNDSLMTLLQPLTDVIASYGLTVDRELGYLALFACPSLLVVGSLLPGI
jgi:hypothetical protein